MSYFPSMFSTVMIICHVYLANAVRRGFGPGWGNGAAMAVLGAGLLASLLRNYIIRLENGPALISALYLWVGLILILFMWVAGRDLLQLAASLLDRSFHTGLSPLLAPRRTIPLAFAVGVLAFAYSLYEASTPRIRRIEIATSLLPAGTERLRVAAFADVHLTRWTSDRRVARIVEEVNAQKPDIIAVLGDLVDDWIVDEPRLYQGMARLEARLGKYAILGNHEVYRGLDQAKLFLERSDLIRLSGEAIEVGGIILAGVDDHVLEGRRTPDEVLREVDQNKFVMLLNHRPEMPHAIVGLFDLQLSGHTHGGQIWPNRFFTRLLSGYWQGLTILNPAAGDAKTSRLYLSNGVGYWGPPVRFLTPPEIVVVDLLPITAANPAGTAASAPAPAPAARR